MNRAWLVLLALLCLYGWWRSPLSPRVPPAPVPVTADGEAPPDCPLPPRVMRGEPPLQTPVDDRFGAIRFDDATLRPLAGFSVEARVLGRKDYEFGRESAYSPTDLALGWGRMGEDAVLQRLQISQGGRWYRYRWTGQPPIPVAEIVRSSANMHMIPANGRVAADLRKIRRDDRVRVDGWLVRLDGDGNWYWKSSLSRKDSGSGACELVYVCAITKL